MADEQTDGKPIEEDTSIYLHAPTDPPEPAQQTPPVEQSPATPVPSQIIQPTTVQAATQAPTQAPAAPPSPAPSNQPAAAPPPTQPAPPTAPVKVQWCPTDQVAVVQPAAGNTCPACGAQLVPLPEEAAPE